MSTGWGEGRGDNPYTFCIPRMNFFSFQPTSCIGVYVDREEVAIAVLCGIPALSSSTKLALSVWNWKNFLTDPSTNDRGIQLWQAAATFSNVTFPAPATSQCRYGNPFRGGGNPIVRYEAGIGSDIGLADVKDFKEVSGIWLLCAGFFNGVCSRDHIVSRLGTGVRGCFSLWTSFLLALVHLVSILAPHS